MYRIEPHINDVSATAGTRNQADSGYGGHAGIEPMLSNEVGRGVSGSGGASSSCVNFSHAHTRARPTSWRFVDGRWNWEVAVGEGIKFLLPSEESPWP